jgi:GT2 family glycosyltransferase
MSHRVRILIPSYCSWENLRRNLPHLLEEVPAGSILISDDASPDGTPDRLAEAFPDVPLLRSDVNRGFGGNCNTGMRALEDAEIVFLLNADVQVLPGFLPPLLEHFEDPDVFAVSSMAVSSDGREVTDGPRMGHFKRGNLKWNKLDLAPLLESTETLPTLYAVGAHTAVRRETFQELGGFDDLYLPFYWEDVDLSYRALKRGKGVLIDTRSRVVHDRTHSDIERTQPKRRYVGVNHRNRFLFTWKNLHDRGVLLRAHLGPVLARTLLGWLALDWRFYRALFGALPRLRRTLAERRGERAASVRGDAEIFEEVGRGLEWLASERSSRLS